MNKWQIIDYVYWNRDLLEERDIWRLVDQISDQSALEMISAWLYHTHAPGSIHAQAQGIIEWYQQQGFITSRQRRWLVLTMITYWSTTSCEFHNQWSGSL